MFFLYISDRNRILTGQCICSQHQKKAEPGNPHGGLCKAPRSLDVRRVLLFLWRLILVPLFFSFYTPHLVLYMGLTILANVLPWFQSLSRLCGRPKVMFHKLRRVCQHWVGAVPLSQFTSSAAILLVRVVFWRY